MKNWFSIVITSYSIHYTKLYDVSQFTLHASTKKGNRPSYIRASKPDFAVPMYEKFIKKTEEILGKKVGTGIFGAMMDVRNNFV